jgi:hypothetical protein
VLPQKQLPANPEMTNGPTVSCHDVVADQIGAAVILAVCLIIIEIAAIEVGTEKAKLASPRSACSETNSATVKTAAAEDITSVEATTSVPTDSGSAECCGRRNQTNHYQRHDGDNLVPQHVCIPPTKLSRCWDPFIGGIISNADGYSR